MAENDRTLRVEDAQRGESRTSPQMLSVDDVARMLNCSPRHVYRLADSGRMPQPLKLGALNRWPSEVIEGWIANGCPSCRKGQR
jgi:excisionase family DNA binding protein